VRVRARSLAEGESVVLRLRPHGRALVLPAGAFVLVMGIGGYLAATVPGGGWQPAGRAAVVAVGVLLVWRLSVRPWLRWLGTRIVVTDRRVRLRAGLLRTSSRDVPLGRVVEVGVTRTLLQRATGSGTLLLDTTGDRGTVEVRDVPDVDEVARVVTELVDDLLDGALAG
jgi:uncharacterized membrane protein YdbT with pleckstrin-like domain